MRSERALFGFSILPSFPSCARAKEENRQAFEVLIEMLIDSPKASTKAFFSDVLNDVAINDRSIPGNEDLMVFLLGT